MSRCLTTSVLIEDGLRRRQPSRVGPARLPPQRQTVARGHERCELVSGKQPGTTETFLRRVCNATLSRR